MGQENLDTFDARILNLLQQDNRMTADAIAHEIGLSAAAVQKRLKRLRSGNVIESEIAILSPHALGLNLTAVVQVRLSRDSSAELDRFKKRMLKAPEVIQCYYVTGECNFVLLVAMPDMQTYQAFSKRYFIDDDGVAQFVTSVIMERVKSHGSIEIPT